MSTNPAGDLRERILLAATIACGYTSWAEAESVNEGDDAGGLRAIADGVLAVVQPELERLTKLAEANGGQARFWADHFAEVEKANRDALGAHHKAGHTVAELITALVGELVEAREFGNDAMNKTREIAKWVEGYGKLSADNKRLTRERDEALRAGPAVHAGVLAKPDGVLYALLLVWLDSPMNRKSPESAADAAVSAVNWFLRAAPVSGSDTTEDGGQAWHVGDDPSADRALLLDAAEYVINGRHASVSAMQRNIRVGFAKASQLMDLLETWGIVGPAEGSMARKVLVPREHLHDVVEAIREGEQ